MKPQRKNALILLALFAAFVAAYYLPELLK